MWVLGSKGYLLHGPYFLGYDRTRTRKWVKFDSMAAYLNCCVPRADFHFMEALCPYYSYTHLWVLGSKGYLIYGRYFFRYDRPRTWKWVKFDSMAAYLNCCVPREDFHFMEVYGLYYSYTHLWVLGSKGYLLHGHYFLVYDRTKTRKWVKFDCMAAYLNCCVPRADFHFMEA